MSPISAACAAEILSPVMMSSSPRLRGTLRKIVAMIIIGHRPTLISGVPSCASSAAMATSQATTSPSPPASACPLTIAMVGLPTRVSARFRSTNVPGLVDSLPPDCSGVPPEPIDDKSPPAEKTLPAPVSTMTRTAPSALARSSACNSSPMVVGPSGLRFSGRLRVMRAVAPRTSYTISL